MSNVLFQIASYLIQLPKGWLVLLSIVGVITAAMVLASTFSFLQSRYPYKIRHGVPEAWLIPLPKFKQNHRVVDLDKI